MTVRIPQQGQKRQGNFCFHAIPIPLLSYFINSVCFPLITPHTPLDVIVSVFHIFIPKPRVPSIYSLQQLTVQAIDILFVINLLFILIIKYSVSIPFIVTTCCYLCYHNQNGIFQLYLRKYFLMSLCSTIHFMHYCFNLIRKAIALHSSSTSSAVIIPWLVVKNFLSS